MSRLRAEEVRSIFENVHAVMLIIDPDSADIIDANPAAIEFYGYSLDEITSMKITDINTLTKDQVFEEMDMARTEKRMYFNFRHKLSDGEVRDVEVYSGPIDMKDRKILFSIVHDITKRKRAEAERDKLIVELKEALAKVKTLHGMLPICSSCSKIRDDKGYWNKVADYISEHADVEFTHGLCPDCAKKLYPGFVHHDEEK